MKLQKFAHLAKSISSDSRDGLQVFVTFCDSITRIDRFYVVNLADHFIGRIVRAINSQLDRQ